MDGAKVYPLPARDPVSGGPLVITELESPDTGVTIRGRFEMPRFAQLSPDQARYLETFLRCRGMLNSVERELGISYPTARARLDGVLKALDLHAVREEGPSSTGQAEPSFQPSSGAEESLSTGEMTWEAMSDSERTFPQDGFEDPVAEAAAQETLSIDQSPPLDEALEETALEEIAPEASAPRRTRNEILTLLERGEITPEEAKRELSQ